MGEFLPGQVLRASDLNELVKSRNDEVILSTKDQKLINTSKGPIYQEFYKSRQSSVTMNRPLDIRLQPIVTESGVRQAVWMYINANNSYKNKYENGYPFCKYNGEPVRAIVGGFKATYPTETTTWSILTPGQDQKLYEDDVVKRGSDGLGWWWTGLSLPETDIGLSANLNGGKNIVAQIFDMKDAQGKVFYGLLVTWNDKFNDIGIDDIRNLEIDVDENTKAHPNTLVSSGDKITIAQLQADRQQYGELGVQTQWQYAQVTNDIDQKLSYEPWELFPQFLGGYHECENHVRDIQVWKPIYTMDGSQGMIGGKFLLDVGKKTDDLLNTGLTLYAVHRLKTKEVSLSVGEWKYIDDETLEQDLPAKLSAFNDGENEGQLVCWINTYSVQWFNRNPTFTSELSSNFLVDSEISAIGLSSIQRNDNLSSLAPELTADPKLSSETSFYELYKFDDLTYKDDVTRIVGGDDELSAGVIVRVSDEQGQAGLGTNIGYIDLSSIQFNPDSKFHMEPAVNSASLCAERMPHLSTFVGRINGWDPADDTYEPRTRTEVESDGVGNYNAFFRKKDGAIEKTAFVGLDTVIDMAKGSLSSTQIDVLTDIQFEVQYGRIKATLTKKKVTVLNKEDATPAEKVVVELDEQDMVTESNYDTGTHKFVNTVQPVYVIKRGNDRDVDVFEATPHDGGQG